LRRSAVWLLVVFCYLYPFPYFQRLNNPNENVRIWQTRALAQYGQLDITPVTRDWGFVDDKAAVGGGVVSGKAPGTSLLGVPILFAEDVIFRMLHLASPSQRVVTWTLRVFAVSLPMAAFLFFFSRSVERVTQSAAARDLSVLGLGLGTPMYPYGLLFVGHSLGAALAFVAYALLGRRRLLAAGIAAGLSIVFEYQLVIVVAILSIWAFAAHGRRACRFLLGNLPAGFLLGVLQARLFGVPWAFSYGHLENPSFAAHHHATGFFGFTTPSLSAFVSLLFSPDLGLFAFAPFLLLGLAGAVKAIRTGPRAEGIVILAVAVSMLAFQSGMTNWRGGWSVGPRYAVVVAPFLASGIGMLVWGQAPLSGTLAALLGGLVGVSVFMCGLSGAVFPHYPSAYDNPVFELVVPLVRRGYASYNAGQIVGLKGALSLVPLAIAACAAWLLAMWRPFVSAKSSTMRTLAGSLLAGGLLWAMGRYGNHEGAGQLEATQIVESIWEPPP
jgi:hypothetical protein